MAVEVKKEIVVGEVVKDEKTKYVIASIESNLGEFVSVQQQYVNKDGEWTKGKGQWIPMGLANEIGLFIQEASEQEEV